MRYALAGTVAGIATSLAARPFVLALATLTPTIAVVPRTPAAAIAVYILSRRLPRQRVPKPGPSPMTASRFWSNIDVSPSTVQARPFRSGITGRVPVRDGQANEQPRLSE